MLNVVDKMCIAMKSRWNAFRKEERGDVNIVSIVVLCGIVIVVAIVFRKQLTDMIEGLFTTISDNADKAVNGEDSV